MIKIPAKQLFIQNNTGEAEPFHIEVFEKELGQSFQNAGINEDWIPREISEAVIDHLQLPQENGEYRLPSRSDLDTLVKTILINAGYPDVAADFCTRRGAPIEEETAKNADEWTEQRVRRTLQQALALEPETLENLTQGVMDKLRDLGFEQVTDSLIEGIGRHLFVNLGTDVESEHVSRSAPNGQESPDRFFFSTISSSQLSSTCRELIEKGAIRLHPANRLLPLVRCTVNLDIYGRQIDNGPLTELTLLPRIPALAEGCAEAISTARSSLCQECPHAAQHPVRIHLAGLQRLFEDMIVTKSVAAHEQLYAEIDRIFRSVLARYAKGIDFVIVADNGEQREHKV